MIIFCHSNDNVVEFDNNDSDCWMLIGYFHVLGTVLSTLHVLSYWILKYVWKVYIIITPLEWVLIPLKLSHYYVKEHKTEHREMKQHKTGRWKSKESGKEKSQPL